jgi:hypothetical protein
VRRESTADPLLRICGLLSVIALGLVVITMQRDIPDTVVNSVIDGVRFVFGVAAAIGGVVLMLERRALALEEGSIEVVDLREIDLRDGAAEPAPSSASLVD